MLSNITKISSKHLTFGLVAMAFLAIVVLSGSINTFRPIKKRKQRRGTSCRKKNDAVLHCSSHHSDCNTLLKTVRNHASRIEHNKIYLLVDISTHGDIYNQEFHGDIYNQEFHRDI